jgi:endo-1,4-beta-xylanase
MKKSINNLIYLLILFSTVQACKTPPEAYHGKEYVAIEQNITVDADTSDWIGISNELVNQKSHLWIGQGMEGKNWLGPGDLSYNWRAAWHKNKIYFLFVVSDDSISPFNRENTWLNDCVEICLDPSFSRGIRKITEDGISKLNGYETHFLPMQTPRAYLLDDKDLYRKDYPQDSIFNSRWQGEMAVAYTSKGYILEVGFSIPDVTLKKNLVIGIEIAVCDDDGNSRKSLLTWTGIQNDYWIKMDRYGKLLFE